MEKGLIDLFYILLKLYPFFTGLFFFLVGVFLADLFREYWVLSCVFFIFFLFFLHIEKKIQNIIFSCIGFLSGCIFLFWSLPNIEEMIVVPFANNSQEIEMIGIIDSFPVQKERKIQFYMDILQIKTDVNSEWSDISRDTERILIQQKGFHSFGYGEIIKVWGVIERPGEWEKFSYNRYLEREGVYSLVKNAVIKKMEKEEYQYSFWQKTWITMFSFREWFEVQIRHRIEFPEDEYALGIILGAEAGIPTEIIDDFNVTGLRHLLALSGMNITILIVFMGWIFFFLPIYLRIFLTALLIFLFVGLTGGSSSVVRAAVMGVLGMIALYSGRKMKPIFIMLLALFFMTLWNPFLLVADVSLQFSVLAVLGLLYIVPLFEKTFPFFSSFPKDLLLVFYATLSAQIATLPLIIVFFEQVSLISPLANILVAPLTTFSMFFGFAVSIPYIGWIFLPFAYSLLHIAIIIAEKLADIPFAALPISGVGIVWIIPFYIIIIFLIWLWKRALA